MACNLALCLGRARLIHSLYILRRMQEEFCGREKKLYMCFVDLEKAFDRVPRKVMEWTLRKKSLSEVLVQARGRWGKTGRGTK